MPHPVGARAVVHVSPALERAVFRGESELQFESGGSIRTVDVGGKIIGIEPSASGAFLGVAVVDPSAESLRLTRFTAEGELDLEHVLAHHPDDRRPEVAVSDGGDIVFARPASAEICFLSSDVCSLLFEEAEYALERNVLVEFDPHGQFVAVAAQEHSAAPESVANASLLLFSREGALMWRRPLSEPGIGALAVSPEGLIAVSTYDAYSEPEIVHQSRLLDRSGAEIAAAPFGADRFEFGADQTFLITSKSVAVINADGDFRQLMTPEPGTMIISAVPVDGVVSSAVVTGRSVYGESGFEFEDLRLFGLDEGGQILTVEEVGGEAQRTVKLEHEAGTQGVSIVLDKATHSYRWHQ